MNDADKLSIIGPTPKTDAQVREESKRVIIAYLESVAAMEARIAELEAAPTKSNMQPSNFEKQIESLRATIDELTKDAARYRHMRSSAAFQNRNGPGLYWYLPREHGDLPYGERLDAVIDAALKSIKEMNDGDRNEAIATEIERGKLLAIRQYLHNDNSGLVFGYDKELIDALLERLAALKSIDPESTP